MPKINALEVRFFRTTTGREPVKEWLEGLSSEERKSIAVDIATVRHGWPIGMPTCRPLKKGLFEVRSRLQTRIARILFCFRKHELILLHGFIKKTQETPHRDLQLALARKKEVE